MALFDDLVNSEEVTTAITQLVMIDIESMNSVDIVDFSAASNDDKDTSYQDFRPISVVPLDKIPLPENGNGAGRITFEGFKTSLLRTYSLRESDTTSELGTQEFGKFDDAKVQNALSRVCDDIVDVGSFQPVNITALPLPTRTHVTFDTLLENSMLIAFWKKPY